MPPTAKFGVLSELAVRTVHHDGAGSAVVAPPENHPRNAQS